MDRKLPLILLLLLLTLGVLAAAPAAAQSGVTWTGSYYDTAYLTGGAVFTRQDNAIAFDWGTGSPDSRLGNDNFSVRWGTDVYLPAGTYRFWALADDNVRVNIDFAFSPQIDTWNTSTVNQTVSADVTLSEGTHHIQVDYRELTGNARVYVTWANLATNPSGPNFPAPAPQPIPVSSGPWTAQYYSNQSLSGNPTVIVSENNPSHDWGTGAPFSNMPADNFSARWSSLQTLNGGTYRIAVRSDDGVRVYVNGQRLIDEWHGATGQTYIADISLPFGQHNFMIEYYESGGRAFLDYSLALTSAAAPPTVPPPVISPPVTSPPGNVGFGNWLVTYFNNRQLSGTPSAILSVPSPTNNWGTGSPVPSVAPDNFSARWTTTQTLAAGTYRVTARADDGVRVFINGVPVINEWHEASGQTYTGDINLPAGTHSFSVEYYEATGQAFLDFSFGPASAAPQPPSQGGGTGSASGTATVNAFRLNVRQQPTTTSTIIAKINRGESYPIIGCNTDQSWWQININGTPGWVFANFVNVANANCVPSAGDASPQQPTTGYTVTAFTNVNIRSQPTTNSAILGTLRSGQSAQVVGRNSAGTWWQINVNNSVGWVSAAYARIQPGADTGQIPVR